MNKMKRRFTVLFITIVLGAYSVLPSSGFANDDDLNGCIDTLLNHQHDATSFGRLTSSNRSGADKWITIKSTSQLGLSYILLMKRDDQYIVFAYETLLGLSMIQFDSQEGDDLYTGIFKFVEIQNDYRGTSTFDSGTCDFVRIFADGKYHDGFYLDLPSTLLDGQEPHPVQGLKELAFSAFGKVNLEDVRPVFPDNFSSAEIFSIQSQLAKDVFFELSLKQQAELID